MVVIAVAVVVGVAVVGVAGVVVAVVAVVDGCVVLRLSLFLLLLLF